MNRWLKLFLKILAGILILVVLVWLIALLLVNYHKKTILNTITTALNEQVNGTVTIKNIDLSFFKNFPGASISLNDVAVHDTLYASHKHELLNAQHVYIAVNTWSLIKGTPQIGNVSIEDAAVYLFTDSTGYSNTSVFAQKKKNKDQTKKTQIDFHDVTLSNIHFVFENQTKFKFFQIVAHQVHALVENNDAGWKATAAIDALINDFTFNTGKGSFLKAKKLRANVEIGYTTAQQKLEIPLQNITLDDDEIQFGGSFIFSQNPATFSLVVTSQGIKYNNAIALLSPNITRKLKVINFEDPIALNASIIGKMKFRDTPLVRVAWTIKNNTFITPGGPIKNCSFQGIFTNQTDTAKGHNDHNSAIQLSGFHGAWNNIPFKADSVRINDLIDPKLKARFSASFPLTKANKIIGTRLFSFTSGHASFDILYKGGLRDADTTSPYMKGFLKVQGLGMVYTPRKLSFNNSNLTLLFTGHDLLLRDGKLHSKSSTLFLSGEILNFLNLYYTHPEKILLNWKLSSPEINLNEFASFLATRTVENTANRPTTNNKKLLRANKQLEEILEKGAAKLDVNVAKLTYRKFTATGIKANVLLANSAITLSNTSLQHAGGSIAIDATLKQHGRINDVQLNSTIQNVNINRFLTAMENFGQDAITDDNLQGYLFAHANLQTTITDAGKIKPNSLKGTLSFKVTDGALLNFEPIQKIGNIIFRRRDLKHITFHDVKNTLDLKGNLIVINPMHIESSALTINVEGIYDLQKKLTNIQVDVPLRNPKKDELIADDSLRAARSMKGIVIHLTGVNGNDGNVKFKLFGKRKQKEEIIQEEQ